MLLSLLSSTSFSFAAGPAGCAPPDRPGTVILDDDLTPSGAVYVLTEAAAFVCWWSVDDAGAATVEHRWSRDGRVPTRVEALPDGRAAFVMNDLRLQVRHPDDVEYRNVSLELPGKPDVVLGHGRRDWLAISVPVDNDTDRVLLVDVDRERVVASIALPSLALALSFLADRDVLYLDGEHSLVLSEEGFTSLGQSR
jgi:hypothetical protein